jgi:hypothetical protein
MSYWASTSLIPKRTVRHPLGWEILMYGKMSVASGTIATGALLAAGMRMMAWVIVGGFAVVLGGLMLYRLATIKARR